MKSEPTGGPATLSPTGRPHFHQAFQQDLPRLAPEDSGTGIWFLVYTKPRQETIAVLNLQHQGFETYLPQYKKPAPRSGAKSPAAARQDGQPRPAAAPGSFEHLFPRYVFFRPLRSSQSIASARSTRGVLNLVSFGGEAAQVADAAIAAIRAFEQQRNEAGLEPPNPFQPGHEVRLRNSALDGLKGLVKSISSDRVNVLIELLGRQKIVALEQNQLELA